MFMISMQISQN